MGRPLNKKYMGNRNIGTNRPTDDGIGGEGIASVTLGTLGSYTTRPTVTFATPIIANGTTATGTVTSEVLSAAVGGVQTRAYPVAAGAISFAGGDVTSTYTATVTSAALVSVVYASATTISFSTTTTAMISGTSIVISGSSITGNMTIGGVAIAAGQTYYAGAPTTATAATLYATYSNAVTGTSPLTISNGTTTGATFTFGTTYGTVTALTPVNRGSFSTLVTGAQTAVTGDGSGSSLTITPTYRAKAVVITQRGSGYTGNEAAPTFTQSVTGTSVLTTDSGAVGSATNDENAILAWAYTGGNLVEVDLQKQISAKRYRFNKTGEVSRTGTEIGRIKYTGVADGTAGNTAAEGVELNIVAVDASGGTYLVRKLYNRTCTVNPVAFASTPGTAFGLGGSTSAGSVYTAGKQYKWTFGTATADCVKILNA